MAHFALVQDGIVRNVVAVSNAAIDDLPFPESEPCGQAFIATLPDLGAGTGEWRQTSYSGSFRGCFAGLGYSFDGINFIPLPAADPTPDALAP